jgi:hypothetical protein
MPLSRWSESILNKLEEKSQAETFAVDFVGLDGLELDDFTLASIKVITQRSIENIKAIIRQNTSLKVNIKRHFAAYENKQHKYTVVLHLEYSGNYLTVEHANDWDLIEAVRIATEELESRINRIFKAQGVEARDSAESRNDERRAELFLPDHDGRYIPPNRGRH